MLAGFEDALRTAGLSLANREIGSVTSSVEAGRAGLARLIAKNADLDCVYFSNDDMAIGGYFHCMGAELDTPRDLALFGHNALAIGQAAPQALASIRTPRVEIGRVAARVALSNEPSTPNRPRFRAR